MSGELQVALGHALRRCMDEQGRTQADVARAVGCSQKHLSKTLNNRSAGSCAFFDSLAAELGVVFEVTCRAVAP